MSRLVWSWIGTALIAQSLWADEIRFQFRKGETLTYRLVQTTQVQETIPDEKTSRPMTSETTHRIEVTRKWRVVSVDEAGTAELELTIAAMRLERTSGGETDVFDSRQPDELNKHEMARHIGPVLARVRLDARGRLVDVLESKVGSAARLAADLPFKLVLPDRTPRPGDRWERTFMIVLDPPIGTGEKYTAVQTYTCREMERRLLSVAVQTAIKDPPESSSDRVPLVTFETSGTVYFDMSAGRYHGARLQVERNLKNHLGEGSRYVYSNSLVEDLVPDK